MTRRLEAGPLLVTLGALLLLVSLFLNWYTGEITAWEAFEVWDLVLFVLALGAIAAGLGLTTQDVDLVDRRLLPVGVVVVAVIVASQIIDPPPAAAGQDPDTGAWLALGAALRDVRRRGAHVRARAPRAHGRGARAAPARVAPSTRAGRPTRRPTTCRRSLTPEREAARLFARERPPSRTPHDAEDAPRSRGAAPAAGNDPPEPKQD